MCIRDSNYFEPATPDQRIRAVPGEGEQVEVWVLGLSLIHI